VRRPPRAGDGRWSLLDAWTGVRYDAPRATLSVGPRKGTYPFVTGAAWGTVTVHADGTAKFEVIGGALPPGTHVEVDATR
jgi:hypothetical protein